MSSQFHILIVEDNLMIAEMAKQMLLELGYSVVGVAKNYAETNRYLEQSRPIDVAILDINLSDEKSGIDVGVLLRDKYKIPFVYLTSYTDPQTIKAAVSTAPSAYLIKPFSKSDLFASIEIIRSKRIEDSRVILVRNLNESVKVEASDILYVESDNNYIDIHTTLKKYTLRQSLEGFLEEIQSANFVRVHRSFVVNLAKVEAVNGRYVVVNSEKIALSRTYKNELMELFSKKM
jgi:two-component system, LytTR family, response regulator LytT